MNTPNINLSQAVHNFRGLVITHTFRLTGNVVEPGLVEETFLTSILDSIMLLNQNITHIQRKEQWVTIEVKSDPDILFTYGSHLYERTDAPYSGLVRDFHDLLKLIMSTNRSCDVTVTISVEDRNTEQQKIDERIIQSEKQIIKEFEDLMDQRAKEDRKSKTKQEKE